MFQFGDVIANLLGGSIGLYISYKLEQKYRSSDANGLHESPDLENPGESDNQLLYEFRSDLQFQVSGDALIAFGMRAICTWPVEFAPQHWSVVMARGGLQKHTARIGGTDALDSLPIGMGTSQVEIDQSGRQGMETFIDYDQGSWDP